MSRIIPVNNHVAGDSGHISEHNNMSDLFTMLAVTTGVNVLAAPYNADNTGSAPAATAFQNAINTGLPVIVPPGTYNLNAGGLLAVSGMKLIAPGGWQNTQLNCNGTNWLFNMDPTAYGASTPMEDILISGLTINATGMDIFWGANLVRSQVINNFLLQNSVGKCIWNVTDSTGQNGVAGTGTTYMAENVFANKEQSSGARTIEAWHLDFSGAGKRANDNIWMKGPGKIWTGTGSFWLRLIGDATVLGSKHNTWRDLIFEASGGIGGEIWLQNTSDFLIDNISAEDIGAGTVSNPLILLNAYTTGPGVQGGKIKNYSRRSGSNISTTNPDIKLDANATSVEISSTSQSSGGTALTVDLGGATGGITLSGIWPSSANVINPPASNYAAPPAAPASFTPADPATTVSTTLVMAGLGSTYTPAGTGKVLVTITGMVTSITAAVSGNIGARFGTGTAPVNGAAVTGTRFGAATDPSWRAGGTAGGVGFAFTGVLSLTPGTTYWFDVAFDTGTAADAAKLTGIAMTITELPRS